MKKKMLKKTSYQRAKEEFEAVKEKRRKKKEVIFLFLFKVTDFEYWQVTSFISFYCLIPGVPEEQAAERRSHSEVQREKDGDVSDAQQENKERTAKPQPPNGVFASKDPGNRKMTRITTGPGEGMGKRASPSCLGLI